MKKLLALMLAIAIAQSCNTTTDEPSGDSNIRFYRDPVTHVEYVLYGAGYGCSITPRLNADGTPHISDKEE